MPSRRSPTRIAAVLAALGLVVLGCGGQGGHGRAASSPTSTFGPAVRSQGPASPPTSVPVALDPDVAALPDGRGAKIAVVVDDAGISDTYLADYLRLPVPVTISIIPFTAHAAADAGMAEAAGRETMLHIPLANRAGPGGAPSGGLALGTPAAAVDDYVSRALAQIPKAVGANNHEGPVGSASPELMRPLLEALRAHGLFFLDSVTSQRTVGFSVALSLGMPPRINNVFLDHYESDDDSRAGVLTLARDAADHRGAIGICHVFHPYVVHAVAALAPQLRAKGYEFSPISAVTDAPAAGLDRGVAGAA